MSNINGPIPAEWGGYVTQSNVGLEIIPHILYDTQTFVDATTQILAFFNAVPANESISNVNPPAQLPNPNSFLIKNIGIFFPTDLETIDQGAAAAVLPSRFSDIILLVNTGICRLTIGDKPYGPWPMYRLPIGTYPKLTGLAAAGAEAANLVSAYGNTDGPLYPLLPPLLIAPMQRFRLTLEWPAGAPNTTANRDIKVILDGQLSRAIQ
ncbi:hypothetical protein L0244_38720 [bacterium]|nr:hypothetical protein [bacterium]